MSIDDTSELQPVEPEPGVALSGPRSPEVGPASSSEAAPVVEDDDVWPTGGPPRGVRLRLPTALLTAGVVAALGFWGGAVVQRHRAGTTTSPARSATRAAAGGAVAGTGATSGGGAGRGAGRGGGTVGTVKSIDGSTLYVTDATGNTVAVTTTDSSTVNKTDKGAVADIHPGDTVVVQGAKNPDGTTTAQSVTIGAPGTGTGGFAGSSRGGGGGGGGGAGAAGGAPTTVVVPPGG